MQRIIDLDIESATLVVGRRLAESIQAPTEDSTGFGKLTLIAQSFFDIDILVNLGRESFLPPPRIESSIIQLNPKESSLDIREFLLRRLFATSRRNPLVGNCLKEGLVEFTEKQNLGMRSKKEENKASRRNTKFDLKQVAEEYNTSGRLNVTSSDASDRAYLLRAGERAVVEGLGIPSSILGKPFDRLNNSELRILSVALREKNN